MRHFCFMMMAVVAPFIGWAQGKKVGGKPASFIVRLHDNTVVHDCEHPLDYYVDATTLLIIRTSTQEQQKSLPDTLLRKTLTPVEAGSISKVLTADWFKRRQDMPAEMGWSHPCNEERRYKLQVVKGQANMMLNTEGGSYVDLAGELFQAINKLIPAAKKELQIVYSPAQQ